jgi:hypothetical protein
MTAERKLGLLLALTAVACARQPSDSQAESAGAASDGEAWLLAGTNDERFARVAKQLRGFDVAMVETGYRYGELYWAGQDRNWDYAQYQIEKIRTAVANGVERRPKRGPSARMLDGALAGVEEGIAARDLALFAERFQTLTATCNACHQAERVPFVHVRVPTIRISPVGPPLADGGVP